MIDWDGMKLNELNWVRNYTVYTFTVRALKLHTHSSRSRRAVSSDVCISLIRNRAVKKKVCTDIVQTYLVSLPWSFLPCRCSFWLILSCHNPALYPSAPVHALWRIIKIENRRWENHDPKRGSKRMLHH